MRPEPAAGAAGRWDRMRRGFLVTLCFVAGLGALRHVQSPLLWDEAVFLASAETLGQANPYFSDLDERPPLMILLLKCASFVLPLPEGGRILTAALYVLGILLMVRLGERLWGVGEGLVAGALMAASPFFLTWSGAVLTDVPSAVLAIAAVYLACVGAGDRDAASFASGAVLAASFLMRWPTVLVGAAILTMALGGALRIRQLLLCGAGFAAGIVPYLTWAWLRFGNPIEPIRRGVQAIEGSEPIAQWTYYFAAMAILAAPLALSGLVLYLATLSRDSTRGWLKTDLPLVVWSILLPLYLTTVLHKEERYVAAAIPPLFLLAARGWSVAFRRRTLAWRVPVMLLAAASFVCLAWNFDVLELDSDAKKDHRTVSSDISRAAPVIQDAIPDGGVVYANHLWPVVAYATKVETVGLWPRDERFFDHFPSNMSRDGVLVHITGIEKEPGEEWLDSRREFRRVATTGRVVVYAYKAPIASVPEEEVRPRVARARAAYGNGDWAAAAAALTGLRGSQPGVGCIHGWSLYKLGRIEEAELAFSELLEGSPDDECGLTGSGYVWLRHGEHLLAEAAFRKAIAKHPATVDSLFGLGLAVSRQDRDSEAVSIFRSVLELDPGHAEAREILARMEARGTEP